RVTTAQQALSTVTQQWLTAYNDAKAALGISLPDPSNPQAVMDAISSYLQTLYQAEGTQQNNLDATNQDLNNKIAALAAIASQVADDQRLLSDAIGSWQDATSALDQFMAQQLAIKTNLDTAIAQLVSDTHFLGVDQSQ